MKSLLRELFSQENILALLLALILIALVIFTSDTSPTWFYQGF
jgi:lipopolysaccharide/colanic/teichoic acid biosynthesis glycosyltransferase